MPFRSKSLHWFAFLQKRKSMQGFQYEKSDCRSAHELVGEGDTCDGEGKKPLRSVVKQATMRI